MLVFALMSLALLGGEVAAAPFDTPDPKASEEPSLLPPEAMGSSRWKPPFILEVEGPEAPLPNTNIIVRVEIERHLVEATPISIRVEVPEGATLVEGEATETLVEGSKKRIERTFALRLGSSLPMEDLLVKVDQEGEGWGAHAEKAYRFGRDEVRDRVLDLRRGPPIDIGGGRAVRPILVK